MYAFDTTGKGKLMVIFFSWLWLVFKAQQAWNNNRWNISHKIIYWQIYYYSPYMCEMYCCISLNTENSLILGENHDYAAA